MAWNAYPNATNYIILRTNITEDEDYEIIEDQVAATATTYVDNDNLEDGHNIRYTVYAIVSDRTVTRPTFLEITIPSSARMASSSTMLAPTGGQFFLRQDETDKEFDNDVMDTKHSSLLPTRTNTSHALIKALAISRSKATTLQQIEVQRKLFDQLFIADEVKLQNKSLLKKKPSFADYFSQALFE